MSLSPSDLCPVGALTSKPYAFTSRPWELRYILCLLPFFFGVFTLNIVTACTEKLSMDVLKLIN